MNQLQQSEGGESIDTLFRHHQGDDQASMEDHAARCFWRTRDWPLIAVRSAVVLTVIACLLAAFK